MANMTKKRKKAQARLFNELRNQLMIQAEKLGKRDYYTPYRIAEIRSGSLRDILTELYIERANLEYEMQTPGSQKHEVLRKLEKLHRYIAKAERLQENNNSQIAKLIGRKVKIREDLLGVDLPKIRVAL